MATEIAQLVAEGAARLARVSDQPRHEAEILLGAALGASRAYLMAHPEESIVDCDATDRYEANVTRRAQGEPVAYILGEKEFWSLSLEVGPQVLIPRPETEALVERALARLPEGSAARVLDVATGSGAVALAIARERPHANVIGTDVSEAAIAVARRNAGRLRLHRVEFRTGSWFAPVAGLRFDVVVGNPPYIADADPRVEPGVRRFEPHSALFAGPTGLEALQVLVAAAPAHLRPGGWLIVEHGDTQGRAVRGLLERAGLVDVTTFPDLAGLDRCTEGRQLG